MDGSSYLRGAEINMFIRLKNPDGMFCDPVTGLSVVKSDVVEIHKAGSLTQAWLNGGGLVCCDSEMIESESQDKGGKPPFPAESQDNNELEVDSKDESDETSKANDASNNKSKTKTKKKS